MSEDSYSLSYEKIALAYSKGMGIETNCPSCTRKIWLNLAWPGLPKWFLDETGSSDKFRCPWCMGIGMIQNTKLIMCEAGNRSFIPIGEQDYVMIKVRDLTEMLSRTLYGLATRKDSGDVVLSFMGKEQDWKSWCLTIANKVLTNQSSEVRLPVLTL